MTRYRNPVPAVDLIIEIKGRDGQERIVLIRRKNPPYGWALPGGFVEYGESLEEAAVREAKEETSLDVRLVRQFHAYSAPDRDPRRHVISTVYIGRARGTPRARDDAKDAALFSPPRLPSPLAFDHGRILKDYFQFKKDLLQSKPEKSHGQKQPSRKRKG